MGLNVFALTTNGPLEVTAGTSHYQVASDPRFKLCAQQTGPVGLLLWSCLANQRWLVCDPPIGHTICLGAANQAPPQGESWQLAAALRLMISGLDVATRPACASTWCGNVNILASGVVADGQVAGTTDHEIERVVGWTEKIQTAHKDKKLRGSIIFCPEADRDDVNHALDKLQLPPDAKQRCIIAVATAHGAAKALFEVIDILVAEHAAELEVAELVRRFADVRTYQGRLRDVVKEVQRVSLPSSPTFLAQIHRETDVRRDDAYPKLGYRGLGRWAVCFRGDVYLYSRDAGLQLANPPASPHQASVLAARPDDGGQIVVRTGPWGQTLMLWPNGPKLGDCPMGVSLLHLAPAIDPHSLPAVYGRGDHEWLWLPGRADEPVRLIQLNVQETGKNFGELLGVTSGRAAVAQGEAQGHQDCLVIVRAFERAMLWDAVPVGGRARLTCDYYGYEDDGTALGAAVRLVHAMPQPAGALAPLAIAVCASIHGPSSVRDGWVVRVTHLGPGVGLIGRGRQLPLSLPGDFPDARICGVRWLADKRLLVLAETAQTPKRLLAMTSQPVDNDVTQVALWTFASLDILSPLSFADANVSPPNPNHANQQSLTALLTGGPGRVDQAGQVLEVLVPANGTQSFTPRAAWQAAPGWDGRHALAMPDAPEGPTAVAPLEVWRAGSSPEHGARPMLDGQDQRDGQGPAGIWNRRELFRCVQMLRPHAQAGRSAGDYAEYSFEPRAQIADAIWLASRGNAPGLPDHYQALLNGIDDLAPDSELAQAAPAALAAVRARLAALIDASPGQPAPWLPVESSPARAMHALGQAPPDPRSTPDPSQPAAACLRRVKSTVQHAKNHQNQQDLALSHALSADALRSLGVVAIGLGMRAPSKHEFAALAALLVDSDAAPASAAAVSSALPPSFTDEIARRQVLIDDAIRELRGL
jgi:hypothetical protein